MSGCRRLTVDRGRIRLRAPVLGWSCRGLPGVSQMRTLVSFTPDNYFMWSSVEDPQAITPGNRLLTALACPKSSDLTALITTARRIHKLRLRRLRSHTVMVNEGRFGRIAMFEPSSK